MRAGAARSCRVLDRLLIDPRRTGRLELESDRQRREDVAPHVVAKAAADPDRLQDIVTQLRLLGSNAGKTISRRVANESSQLHDPHPDVVQGAMRRDFDDNHSAP